MRFVPNITRPDVIFATIWLLVLALYVPFPTSITPPLGPGLATTLLFNIFSGPIIYFLIRRRITRRLGARPDVTRLHLSQRDQEIIIGFLHIVMLLWVAIFIINVVASGGVPIVWYLTGESRQYSDFGIHTVTGLGEMFCCFSATLCILLFLATRRRVYIWLWVFHLLPFIAQVSRGAIAIFVFQSVCALMMMRQLKMRQVLLAGGICAFAGAMFIVLGMLRGIKMAATDHAGVDQYFGALPIGVYWIWSYVASPLGNVSHAVSVTMWHGYVPQYTLVYLLPSVIRSFFFQGEIYTPLNTDQFNATSIYAPLFMDFGLIGAAIFISILLVFASYVHVMARRGNLFYILLYPALYASLALSFFHIFALTPGVLAVPFLCMWFKKFVENRRDIARLPTGNTSKLVTAHHGAS